MKYIIFKYVKHYFVKLFTNSRAIYVYANIIIIIILRVNRNLYSSKLTSS